MTKPIRLSDYRKRGKSRVTFDKYELRQLLNVYSRRVASGEWRDAVPAYIRDDVTG